MKFQVLYFVLLFGFFSCEATKEKENRNELNVVKHWNFYLGSYTSGESEGIYQLQLDENGELSNLDLVAEAENPSFLAFANNGNHLVAVNENESGKISSFSIQDDSLQLVDQQSTGGAHPCYVSSLRNQVFVANYSGGNLAVFEISGEGKLYESKQILQHEGSGSTERQTNPHAHSVMATENGKQIIAADLGTNSVWVYNWINDAQKYEFKQELALQAGAGPRHLAFHPSKEWLYVVNELDNTVTQINRIGDSLEIAESISTLPADFSGESFCADIHISKDGKFLYVSNRGHNSIAIFSIDSEIGNLELLGTEPVRGDWPRNFSLSPKEDYLLVANQKSNNIVSFRRNAETGLLSFAHEIEAPTPVCILFE